MNFRIKFRITNEKDGEVFNEGLFVFETSFGVGEVAHEFCELDLEGYEDAQER